MKVIWQQMLLSSSQIEEKIRANTYRCIKRVARPKLSPKAERKVLKRKTGLTAKRISGIVRKRHS